MHGGVGWQGIVPSRAAKMGSIAVDKGIAKVGSPGEFYEQLEPERSPSTSSRPRRATCATWSSGSWSASTRGSGTTCRLACARPSTQRVQQQLPDIVRTSPTRSASNIDQLLDVKLMVIRHLEEDPELANRIFLEVGKQELRIILSFGGVFGFRWLPGRRTSPWSCLPGQWWALPICGATGRLRPPTGSACGRSSSRSRSARLGRSHPAGLAAQMLILHEGVSMTVMGSSR